MKTNYDYDETIAKYKAQIKAVEAKKRKAAKETYKRKERQVCKLLLQGLRAGTLYGGNIDSAISHFKSKNNAINKNEGIDSNDATSVITENDVIGNNDATNASPQAYPQN